MPATFSKPILDGLFQDHQYRPPTHRSQISNTKSARELYEDRDTTTGTSEDDDSDEEVDEIEYVFPDEDTQGFVHIVNNRDLQVGYSTKTKEQDLKVYSKFVNYLKKRKTYDKRMPLTVTPEAMYCFIHSVRVRVNCCICNPNKI